MHSPKTHLASDLKVCRACHEVCTFDVWHNDPMSYRQSHAAAGPGIAGDPVPECDCFSGKSSRGQQSKFIPLGIVLLHAAHVGAHQGDGCVQDALVKRVEVAFLNKQGADFLQSKRGVNSAIQFVKHETEQPLLACGILTMPLSEVNLGPIQLRFPSSGLPPGDAISGLWQAKPYLASLACGGRSAKLPGVSRKRQEGWPTIRRSC